MTSYDDTQAFTRNVDLGAPHRARDRRPGRLPDTPTGTWRPPTRRSSSGSPRRAGRFCSGRRGRRPLERHRDHDRAKQRRLEAATRCSRPWGSPPPTGGSSPPGWPSSARSRTSSRPSTRSWTTRSRSGRRGLSDAAAAPGRRPRLRQRLSDVRRASLSQRRQGAACPRRRSRRQGAGARPQHRVAEQLDVADQLQFVDSTIARRHARRPPDLVLALHACDTATDDALARAVRGGHPCLGGPLLPPRHPASARPPARPPAPYRLVTRHGILRERLRRRADRRATRRGLAASSGYRVEVIEFVDSRAHPAQRADPGGPDRCPADAATVTAYRSLVAEWGVQPALATLLAERTLPLLPARAVDAQR